MSTSTAFRGVEITINTGDTNTLRICKVCGLVAGAHPDAELYLDDCGIELVGEHRWEYVSAIYLGDAGKLVRDMWRGMTRKFLRDEILPNGTK